MSDTPRTDAMPTRLSTDGSDVFEIVNANFARQLARELVEYKEGLEYLMKHATMHYTQYGTEIRVVSFNVESKDCPAIIKRLIGEKA